MFSGKRLQDNAEGQSQNERIDGFILLPVRAVPARSQPAPASPRFGVTSTSAPSLCALTGACRIRGRTAHAGRTFTSGLGRRRRNRRQHQSAHLYVARDAGRASRRPPVHPFRLAPRLPLCRERRTRLGGSPANFGSQRFRPLLIAKPPAPAQ